jgi:uncharacterized membrane protein YphA (DoxX/SURF4 family)
MLKKIVLVFLCALLGAVFLFSGYTKLYPIEPFEYTFVDLGFINWQVAPFISRILIGLEFFIGILLLFNISLRKIAYRSGIAVLLIFCVYLILLIFFTGNKGNCGCFGTYIQMTPLQALIKNAIMLGGFFILYKYHDGWWKKNIPQQPTNLHTPSQKGNKKIQLLTLLLFVSSFAMPFILNPVELNYSEAYLNKPEENFKIELDTLYKYATLNVPPKTLSQGKHIIAFMSLKCPHCRIAANKIRIIHERNPSIPFYFVLNGDEKNLKSFFEETHTEDIPHCMLVGGKPINHFIYLAGTEMPAIYLMNNSIVEHTVYYIDLDQGEIEKWLGE